MLDVKAAGRAWVLLVASLASSAAGYERLQTRGRRLHVNAGRLVVTAPELDRVALYDVTGERPRKLAEFGGEQGLYVGQSMGPHGALLRPTDEIVVADTFNHRLQAFDLHGLLAGVRPDLRRAVGRAGRAAGEFDGPMSGLAESALPALRGQLFVADTRNARIQVLDAQWRPLRSIGRRAPDELEWPAAIAFDPSGRLLYVADEGTRRLLAYEADSGKLAFRFDGCADEPLLAPAGLTVTASGELLVTDRVRRRLLRLQPRIDEPHLADALPRGLACAGGFGRFGAGPGQWQYPQSVAVDARGRIYVCDQLDSRCQMFAADGAFLTRFADDWQPPDWAPAVAEPERANAARRSLCSATGAYGVRFRSRPEPIPQGELFELEVSITDGCGAAALAAEGVSLRVHGLMPEHRHGMNSEPHAQDRGGGRFEVSGVLFQMAGLWQLYFDIERGGVTERAQLDLRVE